MPEPNDAIFHITPENINEIADGVFPHKGETKNPLRLSFLEARRLILHRLYYPQWCGDYPSPRQQTEMRRAIKGGASNAVLVTYFHLPKHTIIAFRAGVEAGL